MENEIAVEEVQTPSKAPKKESKVFIVTFNQNRSYELTIGRKTIFFAPYSAQELTEDEINHPDFAQQSGYFNIKEGGRK